MNDLINILNNCIHAIRDSKSLEITISNIRSFIQFLKKDLAGFQKAFVTFLRDKGNAFLAIQEFVNKSPFLQKKISGELFAQNIPQYFIFFEPFIKLNIRGFNEDLQNLVRVLVDYGYIDFANNPLYRTIF